MDNKNSKEKLRIFIGEHCAPCHQFEAMLKEAIQRGDLGANDVEFIDIESEEGFHYLAEYELMSIPSVYKGHQQCEVKYEDDGVSINCPDKDNEIATT
jgi:hypothetical protein